MSTLTWLQPLWGASAQVGGGAAVTPSGCSFILSSLQSGTIGTLVPLAFNGSEPDNGGSFIAPFAMRLKSMAHRNTRSGGLRTNTEFFIRINRGTAVSLGGELAGFEGAAFYDHDIAIAKDDEVELLYTAGNNFSMTIGTSFYFERDGDTSSAPFWMVFGGGLTNYQIATETFAIRKVGVSYAAATTVSHDVTVLKDGVPTVIGTIPIGETSAVFSDVDILILRGETFSAEVSGFGSDGGIITLENEIVAAEVIKGQSLMLFTDSDGNVAQNLPDARMTCPSDGLIKSVSARVGGSVGFSGDIYVSKNGGANEVLASGFSGGFEAVNYAFVAGDVLQFSHTGTGITGMSVQANIGFEFEDLDNIDLSYTHVPTTEPVPIGGEDFFYTGYTSNSGSAFALKGNSYACLEDRYVTSLRANTRSSGMTCNFYVAELNAAYEVVSIVYESPSFVSIVGVVQDIPAVPFVMEKGKYYFVGVARTDSTTLSLGVRNAPLTLSPEPMFLPLGIFTTATASPTVGTFLWQNSQSAFDILIDSYEMGIRESFKYWSVLCEGSADGLVQGFAGVSMRTEAGGVDRVLTASILPTSAYDTIADLAHVKDGDPATRWSFTDANFDAADRRLVISFSSPLAIVEADILATSDGNHDETPTAFKVQGSPDGVNWVDVLTVTGEAAWSSGESRTYEVQAVPTDPSLEPHRYWAVLMTDSHWSSSWFVGQVEMKDTIFGPDLTTTGAAIAGFPTYSTYPATNAFDDSAPSTQGWGGLFSDVRHLDRWVGQDFGAGNEKTIIEVTLQARSFDLSRSPRLGAVMYSDDGTDWKIAWLLDDSLGWSDGERRMYRNPKYIEPAPATGGSFALPFGVPMPIVWLSPEHVILDGSGDVEVMVNRGHGGTIYSAYFKRWANKATISAEAAWGGRDVFNTLAGTFGGYMLQKTITNGRTMLSMTSYNTGVETTFAARDGLVSGSARSGFLNTGIVGNTGTANLLSGHEKAFKDGVLLATPTSAVLPLDKNGIAVVEQTANRGVENIFIEYIATDRYWNGLTGDILIWEEELTDTQIADVHAAMVAYYA